MGCLYGVFGVVGAAEKPAANPTEGRFCLATFNDALGYRESSDKWKGPRGDNGKARGRWQYHWARWQQFGGTRQEYDTLDPASQIRVHGKAMREGLRTAPKGLTVEQTITWLANYHNLGHGSLRVRPYTRDLVRLYKERS